MIPTKEEFKAMQIADRMRRKRFWRWALVILIGTFLLVSVGLTVGFGFLFSPGFRTMLSNVWVQVAIVIIPIVVVWLFIRKGNNDGPLQDEDDDEMSPLASTLTRWLTCIGFHFALYMIGQKFLSYFIYEPYGTTGGWVAFFTFCFRAFGWGFMAYSLWSSFDGDAVGLNKQGAILWFEKYICSASSGFICRGLPEWFGSTIEIVDLVTKNIVIGLIKNGVRELFIVECPGFRAIVDLAFEAAPVKNWIKRILKLGGNIKTDSVKEIEKRLVQELNSVMYAICNGFTMDEDGKKVFTFNHIDDLKRSTNEIARLITSDTSPTGIHARLAKFGYKLKSVTLKDFENEDKSLIQAKQKELAEKPDWANTREKAMDLFNDANTAEPGSMTYAEALTAVQAKEGSIQHVVLDGGATGSKGNRKGKGGGSPSAQPVVIIQPPAPKP